MDPCRSAARALSAARKRVSRATPTDRRDGRSARGWQALALALVGGSHAACGGSVLSPTDAAVGPTDAAVDGGAMLVTDARDARDAVDDAPFVTAMHAPLPQVATAGGPVMHGVRLVTITYADDVHRAQLEAFDQWIGGSSWLTTVGADYGVGAGTLLAHVERPDAAPDAITSTQLEAMIADGIAAGSVPSPPDGDFSNVLYLVYTPVHTVISLVGPGGGAPQQSCQSFGGYHAEVRRGTLHVAYAAVPDCGGGFGGSDVASEELAASHEYIEAATDPLPYSRPAYVLQPDGSTAWAFIGGEIGDLCELTHSVYQTADGHVVQRIWSNAAAAAGADPCIPADPTRTYFNVSVAPGDVQVANAGDTVTFTLSGWSVAPIAPWSLQVQQAGGNIAATSTLASTQLRNGGTTTLTIAIPSDAPSQSYAAFLVSSSETSPRNHQVWPVAVVVN